jgi:hypothetical protein
VHATIHPTRGERDVKKTWIMSGTVSGVTLFNPNGKSQIEDLRAIPRGLPRLKATERSEVTLGIRKGTLP